MEDFEYLNRYEDDLMQQILKVVTSKQWLAGQLLESEDITEVWDKVAPSYVADAVKEIADYPTVALGWAMYLGMAVAKFWDSDWEKYSQVENLYELVRDQRGFDYMDEVVRGEILGMEGEEYNRVERLVQESAQQVLAKIRGEQINPQTSLAFHVFARSVKVLYLIGAAIALQGLGYHFEKVESGN